MILIFGDFFNVSIFEFKVYSVALLHDQRLNLILIIYSLKKLLASVRHKGKPLPVTT